MLINPDDLDFNPELSKKSDWNPPQENPDLEENLYKIRQKLLENFNRETPQWKNNLSPEERVTLLEIKEDPTIDVLPTDKNFGHALISMEWVEQETLKYLNDTKLYAKVTKDDGTLTGRCLKIIKNRENLVKSYCSFLLPKFLLSLGS